MKITKENYNNMEQHENKEHRAKTCYVCKKEPERPSMEKL